jgi:ATP-dependent Lon protease
MGDVMKESTNIAYTFAKTHVGSIAPGNRFFETTVLLYT